MSQDNWPDWERIARSKLVQPKRAICADGKTPIDSRLLTRAFEERVKNDPSNPKSWDRNLAVCLVKNSSGEQVLHAWNDPKRGHAIALHSENNLMKIWDQMRRDDPETTVLQLFSERFPCGELSNNCRELLQRPPYNIDLGRIFYFTSEHEARGYLIALAYFRSDIQKQKP